MDAYALPREYQRLEHRDPAYNAAWGHLRSSTVLGTDVGSNRYAQPTWGRGLPPPSTSSGPAAFLDVDDPRTLTTYSTAIAAGPTTQLIGVERSSSVAASSVEHSRGELPPALGSLQKSQQSVVVSAPPMAIGSRRKIGSQPMIEPVKATVEPSPNHAAMVAPAVPATPLPTAKSIGIGAMKSRPQHSRTPSQASVESAPMAHRAEAAHVPLHQGRKSPEPTGVPMEHRTVESSRNASAMPSGTVTPSRDYSSQAEHNESRGAYVYSNVHAVSTSPESTFDAPDVPSADPTRQHQLGPSSVVQQEEIPTPLAPVEPLVNVQRDSAQYRPSPQYPTHEQAAVQDIGHTPFNATRWMSNRESPLSSPRRTPTRGSPRANRRTPVGMIDRKRDEQRAELLTGTLREATNRIVFLNKTFREVAEAHRLLHDKEISLRSEVAAAEVDAAATFDQCEDIKLELQRSVETLSDQLRQKRERLEKLRRNNERLKRELGTPE